MFSKSDLLIYTYETKPRLLRSYEIWGVDDALIPPKKKRRRNAVMLALWMPCSKSSSVMHLWSNPLCAEKSLRSLKWSTAAPAQCVASRDSA